ncbi:MAG: hypothetical protein LBG99_09035 [Propionibacteriaceae bacterium]|nr:hypothetical protein [Propionibacteriaceae bacterium]
MWIEKSSEEEWDAVVRIIAEAGLVDTAAEIAVRFTLPGKVAAGIVSILAGMIEVDMIHQRNMLRVAITACPDNGLVEVHQVVGTRLPITYRATMEVEGSGDFEQGVHRYTAR